MAGKSDKSALRYVAEALTMGPPAALAVVWAAIVLLGLGHFYDPRDRVDEIGRLFVFLTGGAFACFVTGVLLFVIDSALRRR